MNDKPDPTQTLQEALAEHQAGRLAGAEEMYRAILDADQNHADARHLLALVAFQEGRLDEALAGIDLAIEKNAGVAMFHSNRGKILKSMDRNEDAAEAFGAGLRLAPGHPETLSDLAGAMIGTEDYDAALNFSSRAIALSPKLAPAHFNRGLASAAMGALPDAKISFQATLDIDPAFAPARFEMGKICHDEGDLDAAERHYDQAIRNDPTMSEALVNLANVQRASQRLEEAVENYLLALEMIGDVAIVHGNLGVALHELGDIDGALVAYERALEIESGDSEVRRNRAQALLQLGRFEEGWREFEWRWKTRHFAAIRRTWNMPQWDGTPLDGGTVLIHAEQGFGDCLQFIRFAPLVRKRVARVIVECPAPTAGLVSRVVGVDDVVPAGAPLPEVDAHIPMMSLPGVFGVDLETLPAEVPYLSVADQDRRTWAGRIGPGERLRVGVVWKGSHKHQRNTWRSPGIDALSPLFGVADINFISLQKDDEAADIKAAGLREDVLRLGHEFRDFSETAAVVDNLDLIITPDTAVAHLAGGMGKPVWVMLPHVSEWRWLMDRDDSPWYPTMKLFRQDRRGDWSAPVAQMALELRDLAAGFTSSS